MKLKNISRLLFFALLIMCIAPSCVKEGPAGPTGPAGVDGKDGKDGVDANQTCKMCHNPTKVDLIAVQFQFSKHEYGEAAFEESGNTGCTPCHAQEAFKYVCANKIPSTFTLNTTTGKFVNDYATIASSAYGEIGCSTCHSSIHSTYGSSDLPAFTTTDPVAMTMWGGKKIIDLKQDGGKSNLCVKCHQPRPFTNALTGDIQDYAALVSNPTGIMYDGDPAGKTNKVKPSYRMHTHYGTAGAVFAGVGGIEFGTGYTNSKHTEVASCMDCHMGEMVGRAGGHTFNAIGKFDGCNVAGCHVDSPISSATTSKYWKQTRDDVKLLLSQLSAKLTINGVEIMNRNGDATSNLWYGLTANNYDGYLNVYDPITNPSGKTYNTTSFKFVGTPPATWSQEQKDYNATLPVLTLTNAQFGAIINFQLCLRDYSLGIHNTTYTKTLLTNSIAVL